MNLIEISEQLKDVPDQFLMKEVQAPSGAYPAYLVVTELTRRKRMRDTVMKERPESTVAEDLTQPNPDQIRAAMAQMQQMQQAPQAQMMSQPAPSLNAGLMATPQAAQELAAQDALAAQPVEMAGGGLVAFSEGGNVDENGVIRAFNGFPSYMFEDPYFEERKSPIRGVIGGGFYKDLEQLERLGYTGDQILQMSPEQREDVARQTRAAMASQPVGPVVGTRVVAPGATNVISGSASQTSNVRSDAQPPRIQAPVFIDPFQTQMQANLTAMQNLREPTEQELAGMAARGVERYERMIPDRATPAIREAIAQQEKGIAGRRESNVNQALIQAGLGIMSSKSPRFLQAAGEAGTSALRDYREGMKDIRAGERDLMKSRIELANAESLRDQNKFAAAEKAEQRGLDAYKRGQERLNTESAIIARNQQAAYQQFQASATSAKLPYEIGEIQARTGYLQSGGGRSGSSSAIEKEASEKASLAAIQKGMPGTPAYQQEYNRVYQDMIRLKTGGAQAGATGSAGAEFLGFR